MINPENHEGIVEKEMIKYKRYMISDKVIDYNNDNDIEQIKIFEVKKDFTDKFEMFLNFKIENMNDNI